MALIRPARPDDATRIAAIWNPIIRDTDITFSPVERSPADIATLIESRQADGHGFWVAETGGTVAGFVTYAQFRGGPGYVHSLEHTIHVAPDARGAGLGMALIGAAMDHARAQGARVMVGGITATNEPSLAFHRRAGFAEWGRIPAAGWKFGRWHDLVFMGRDLAR